MSSHLPLLRLFGATFCLLLAGLGATTSRAEEPTDSHVTESFINAPIAEVWRIFTTSDGFKVTGAAQADVDLRIGGVIRSRGDAKGSLGDTETLVSEILAYEPQRMLALRTQQAPASFPHKNAVPGTWTVIHFTPSGEDMTHVRIVDLGYNETADSRALRSFFAERHRAILDHVAKRYWPKCKLCAAEPATTE